MADLTRLDRAIAYLWPQRGAQRAAARRMLEALSYEGARIGRREEGWITGSTSANAEIQGDRMTLRNRVRSLMRDNPYAVKGAGVLVSHRVGTGILTHAASPNTRLNDKLDGLFEQWTERADLYGQTDYYGLQKQLEQSRIESGESLAVFRLDAKDDELPLRLQVLEPDLIDTTKNEKISPTREIIEGIEYEEQVAIAYWLFAAHPGDTNPVHNFSTESTRHLAENVIHYYRPTRPGQRTGVSEFAPVIRRLYDLDGYADAELMRKRVAACSVGFVTSPASLPAASLGPTTVGSDGKRKENLEPGMYHYGKPGESVEYFDPKPSGDYREFFGVELHAIAAGLGVPYELLTGDLSEVNYTSHRGGLVQFRAAVEADQWQLVIPQVCRPVWNRFVRDTEMRPGLTVQAKFTPPRFGLLDPAKEIPAAIEAIQGGLRSWSDTIRREGYEPREVLDELEKDQAEFDKRGLVLTSDGRNAVKKPTEPEPAPTKTRARAEDEDDTEETEDEAA